VTGQHDPQDLPVPVPPSSGSEGQLAAALVMQAQALDAMRHAHSELLIRLEQGPERQALAGALDELRSATERVREGQERAARRLSRSRRRFALLGGLALLVAAASGAIVLWSTDRLLGDAGSREQERREQGTTLAQLAERLDGQQAELRQRADDALAARDDAQQALAEVRERFEALGADLEVARRESEANKQLAERERDRHLSALGESARLREQLLERDSKLEQIGHTLGDLQAGRAVAPAAAIVGSSAGAAGLASRVTSALRGSGVHGISVVEAGAVLEGALSGLLVVHEATEETPSRAVHAERGELAVEAGQPVLRLSNAGTTLESVPLPSIERASWQQLGLALPDAALSVTRLSAALTALIGPQGWRVAELRGWDGETLRGLKLEQVEASGHVTRVLRAERGLVRAGPELELKDGTLRVGEDERAFYAGVYRLALPGANLEAWLGTLASEAH
jgi:hypothetical protein